MQGQVRLSSLISNYTMRYGILVLSFNYTTLCLKF